MNVVWIIFLVVLGCCAKLTHARTLEVGPDKEFALPSVAAIFAVDGDVIEIDAGGTYGNDSVVWKQNNITIKGVNGRPHLHFSGNIPNKKAIWVIQGNRVTVSNVEMSGATVADENGAAIRLEGADFHISDCFIHSNENGILIGNSHPRSEILIENCEFGFNGDGSGSTHNIYVGDAGRFTLRNSYSHDALLGHLVKSRARENYILYNRLFEGAASYAIDLPIGGYALVMGNVIYQGPGTDNSTMVAFGAEGLKYPENLLELVYNSFLNERSSGIFIKTWGESQSTVVNNLFSGTGDVLQGANGKADIENNVHETRLYQEFSPRNVSLQTQMVSKVVDTAIPVISQHDEQLLPDTQFARGKVLTRAVLGKGLDIGSIEYR